MLAKQRWILWALVGCVLVGGQFPSMAAEIPPWLPRYSLDIDLDVARQEVRVQQKVTFTNRHERPASELVFNAHAHFEVAPGDVGLYAKTLELLRVDPSENLDFNGPPLQVNKVTIESTELKFHYREDNQTALEVPLPKPVTKGESVTIVLQFRLRLPQKQGRWGQWKGITFLANWLPLLAVYDEQGWHPVPFIPWHQPFFNEAGIFEARVTLPQEQVVACSAPVFRTRPLPNGLKQIDFTPQCSRDFALLCSQFYREFEDQVGSVKVRCLALPQHEHYARAMVRWACEAIPVYNTWIGPYPYPQFTIAESYFGWLGNECGGLAMIDERCFNMPHLAGPYVEYLISHELLHQWFYNVIGTNGYCETWMDEGITTYISHRLMDKKRGNNDVLLNWPRSVAWLPNIHRKNFQSYSYLGALGRGDGGPCVQEMPKYSHLANLLAMTYDRGRRVMGMIEDRLGEPAFREFLHRIYEKYYFRICRVEDLKRELEEFTGQSWQQFFDQWLYGSGTTDWAIQRVTIDPITSKTKAPGSPYQALPLVTNLRSREKMYRVVVLLQQKGEYNEQTTLGLSFDGSEYYQVRIPIDPSAETITLDDPPTHVQALADNRVRVEIQLPCIPTQISVDPDNLLVDKDPANNSWKTKIRWRFSPLYTPLEETDVTNDYDKWNVNFGVGVFGQAYRDPWYTRSTILGLRGDVYRTQNLNLGTYVGYRTDYRDLVFGFDALKDHWPWPRTQIGFNYERSFGAVGADGDPSERAVLFGRYIFQYGSSLYLPPMQYVEVFGSIQDHNLPPPKQFIPGADHFDQQTLLGVHYRVDYLTPYWDPAGGFRWDIAAANGIPIFGQKESFGRIDSQISFVKALPEWTGSLSETRLAVRLYGGAGVPAKGEYFTLGGSNLFRGYDLEERQGSMIWLCSLEWRIPLIRNVMWDCCDHVASVKNIYLATFYDVGDSYVRSRSLGPVAHALGAGLRIDVAWFSLIERTSLRLDIAQALDGAPLQIWVGAMHPF